MANLSTLFLGKAEKTTGKSNDAKPDKPDGRYGLLFVDDEEHVLSAMKRLFRRENYRIYLATGADQALSILSKEIIQLIISDHRMPGMTGSELLTKVKEVYPETIRIMLTGYADVQSIMGAVNEGAVYKFITKPWNDDDLRLTVSLALEQYDLIQENRALKKEQVNQKKQINQLSKFVNTHRSQLGLTLLKKNLIRQDQLEKALAMQSTTNKILPLILIELGYCDESLLAKIIRQDLHIHGVDPAQFQVPAALASLIPKEICFTNLIVPLKRSDGKLIVAMGDPSDYIKVDDLKFIAGMPVEPVLASHKEIYDKIIELYGEEADQDTLVTQIDMIDPTESIEIILDDDDQIDLDQILLEKDQPPAIRIVNAIISDALRHGASDVHIEPKTKHTMVRYRIDGLLHDKIHVPLTMHPSIVSRIKVMAELDIAERRRPQDGRVTVKTATRMVDMRLSTLPTINGEKIVLRILDRNASIKDLHELGMSSKDLVMVNLLISQPQGCLLSTGPTGSGKTSTLYSLLQKNATITKNFTTIEDPVEYYMGMAEQVMIKEKIGLTFSSVLRAILRQDPNVIMLGEIRDFDTAEIAFHAALTGHLVLSTLHTNGSVASITRLRDMGIKPYVLCDALLGIIAQRLIRKICPDCRKEEPVSDDVFKALRLDPRKVDFIPFKGAGCESCNFTGYSGRIGIFEVFPVNGEIKQLIHQGAGESDLNRVAKFSGMTTLLEDSIEKIKSGLTTCEEILRVLGPQNALEIECPKCRGRMTDRYDFCCHCGGKMIARCNVCKNYLEPPWTACPYCGTPV
ncbi:MAG: Flp pilus assembly complex ATPase component TadA [Proteobacteria bacterium]|nr:Flp pilus assembly complex ATPase component TadA [Pseudomonadota bacterium]